MDWTSWGMVLLVSLVAGATGALVYAQRAALGWAAALARRALARRRRLLQPRPAPAVAAPRRQERSDDTFVLMPDGRPWPLGPAVQVLELAWRWQVVHGANLPIRARQGEGAYVWRPPLPARSNSEQAGAEAEQ